MKRLNAQIGSMRAAAVCVIAAITVQITGGQGLAQTSQEDALFKRDSYQTTPIICPFKGDVDYAADDVSCALLEVPENREKSRGRKIELLFAKIPARAPANWDEATDGAWVKREDPIIYLIGGPGGQASFMIPEFTGHGARDFRDIYVLEQRGVGFSNDFCPLYEARNPAAFNVATVQDHHQASFEAIEACFAKAKASGVDLSAYSTIENARDVKALRRALKLEQWNVWGVSYGTILGQAYLRADPEGVRAAIIDGIVPIEPASAMHNTTAFYDRSLRLLEKACEADPDCANTLSDFPQRLRDLTAALSEAPVEVAALDTETYPTGKHWVFENVLASAPYWMFYDQANYGVIPALINSLANAVENGETESFRLLTQSEPPFSGSSSGMMNAHYCRDGWIEPSRAALNEDRRDFPILYKALEGTLTSPPELINDHNRLCKRYGAEPRPIADYAPLRSDIRTLVVEGAFDPITPPSLAQDIMPGLSNATYVEFPYAGHGPTHSAACAGDFLTKFYDDPNGPLDLSCPESMQAPDFMPPLFQTQGPARLAILEIEDQQRAFLHAGWLGASALVLTIALGVYLINPPLRLLTGGAPLPSRATRAFAAAVALTGLVSIGGLGFATHQTLQTFEMLLMVGLIAPARWFALAGIVAALGGLALLPMAFRAAVTDRAPIVIVLGLLFVALAALSLGGFLSFWGILPI